MSDYFRQRFDEYLNENWPVKIYDFPFDSAEIFKKLAKADYEVSFVEWVQQERQKSRERAKEFLEQTECLDRFRALLSRLKTESVVPFVGAGMSIPSGFQRWGDFILSLLADAPDARMEVIALVDTGLYEEAAQVAYDQLGGDALTEEITNRLGPHHKKVAGPILLLPGIFKGEVFTTNFDYVASYAYEEADNRFVAEICGPALREAMGRLGMDRHCLLRIHGEAASTIGRVLTKTEYETTYTEERSLAALLGEISGPRSFLFMGCSLQSDRTLEALKQIKAASPIQRPPHYAILPLREDDDRNGRRRQLGEAGIHPIYYPDGDHDQCIEDLLICLADGKVDD